jgi:hypothetical protein
MPSIKITDLPVVAFFDVSDADTLLLIDAETLSSKQVTLSNLSNYTSSAVVSSINAVNANVSSLAASINRATDNIQAGTTYTLVLSDANQEIGLTNASSCVVSIPLNASVAFPIGTRIPVWADGTGIYSIVGVSGITLNGVSDGTRTGVITVNTAGIRYAVILRKIDTDSWTVSGSIGAVA